MIIAVPPYGRWTDVPEAVQRAAAHPGSVLGWSADELRQLARGGDEARARLGEVVAGSVPLAGPVEPASLTDEQARARADAQSAAVLLAGLWGDDGPLRQVLPWHDLPWSQPGRPTHPSHALTHELAAGRDAPSVREHVVPALREWMREVLRRPPGSEIAHSYWRARTWEVDDAGEGLYVATVDHDPALTKGALAAAAAACPDDPGVQTAVLDRWQAEGDRGQKGLMDRSAISGSVRLWPALTALAGGATDPVVASRALEHVMQSVLWRHSGTHGVEALDALTSTRAGEREVQLARVALAGVHTSFAAHAVLAADAGRLPEVVDRVCDALVGCGLVMSPVPEEHREPHRGNPTSSVREFAEEALLADGQIHLPDVGEDLDGTEELDEVEMPPGWTDFEELMQAEGLQMDGPIPGNELPPLEVLVSRPVVDDAARRLATETEWRSPRGSWLRWFGRSSRR